jgi:hypothetical protein
MSFQVADFLVHTSNVLLIFAYSVRDILWLRWFAVAAALVNIPYFLLQGTILWPPIVWALVFTMINVYQIARIYKERRPVVLNAEEQKLYDLGFRGLRPRDFVSLLLAGEWKVAAAGEKVLTEGEPVTHISIAIEGSVEVTKDGRPLGSLQPGELIGMTLALTGNPSTVNGVFTGGARYLSWPVQGLRTFVERRPELRVTLQQLASRDLARKLEKLASS